MGGFIGEREMGRLDACAARIGAVARRGLDRRALFRRAAGLAALTAGVRALGGASAAPNAGTAPSGVLHLGPRAIPTPKTISPQAQQSLAEGAARLNAMMAAGGPAEPSPAPEDAAAWKARVAAVEKAFEPRARRTVDR